MFASIDELKELIRWAKSEKVQAFQVGDVRVEFSTAAMFENLPDAGSPTTDLSVPPSSPNLPSGNTQPSDEDEDTYWSSRA